MLFDFFSQFRARWRQLRGTRPLRSPYRDVRLLRQVRGRLRPGLKQLAHAQTVLSERERRLIQLCWALVAVGGAWLGVGALWRYRTIVPAVGGQYTEAVVGSPQMINPIFASLNDVDQDLTRLVYTGLIRYDKEQRLVPDLAASIEQSEDKKTYTFQLRQDVVWHDGTPFTAQDVVFTFETIQNSAAGSPLLISFQGVEVEEADKYTVRLRLKEPFPPFLSSLTVGILPAHIWFDVPPGHLRLHSNNLRPVGTGPFLFKKLSKSKSGFIQECELARFDRFYRPPPYIGKFTIRFFAEYEGPEGAIQALRSAQADGLSFVPQTLRGKVERKHTRLHTLQLPQYTALFFNQEQQPILKQEAVRLALAQALDKQRLLREALKHEGQIIHSPVLPGFPGYNPEIDQVAYDAAGANAGLDKDWARLTSEDYRRTRRAELWKEQEAALAATATVQTSAVAVNQIEVSAEASTSSRRDQLELEIEARLNGEINSAQTFFRQDKDGRILELTLVTADTPEYRQASTLVAGFWQEIGVKTRLEYADAKEMPRSVLKGRKYDILLYGMIVGGDPDQFPFWHSSQADFPGLNLARYVNRNADAVLQAIRETDNNEKAVQLSQEFQKIIFKDRPAIFLYMPTYTYATTDKINGLDVARISHPADRFANVTEWYMETKGEWRFGDKRD